MGLFSHDARLFKFDVLRYVSQLAFSGELITDEKLSGFYKRLIPNGKANFRCCIYKEREILRQRGRLVCGKMANDKTEINYRQVVQVIDAACDGCAIKKIHVTDNCRKCMAKACRSACKFSAMHIGSSKAEIEYDKCVECGACARACPYNAIVMTQRPCKASCPVDAISWNEHDIALIDEKKCINCGRCVSSCPFGAIEDISWIIPVIQDIKAGKKVYAIVAPSIQGQFDTATLEQIKSGIKKLGFTDVFEAALGADMVAITEYEELKEHMAEGKPITTSCCPAFVNMAKIHFPKVYEENVSTVVSPMMARATVLKEAEPDCEIVFIGPCIAKKQEAMEEHTNIDFVITFEELAAMFISQGIYLKEMSNENDEWEASTHGRNFAQGGGVSNAVIQVARDKGDTDITSYYADGAFDCKKQLTLLQVGRFTYDILEGMCCDGGCIGGPCTISDALDTKKRMNAENEKRTLKINEALLNMDIDPSKFEVHRHKD